MASAPRTSKHQNSEYRVGWICALPIEFTAARLALDEIHGQPKVQSEIDVNSYELGRMGGHFVVITTSSGAGTTPAATLITRMAHTFQAIRFIFMVGIGGGIPRKAHDIRLGDVVVSKPDGMHGGVVQYDLGKRLANGAFVRTGYLNRPPEVLINVANMLVGRQNHAEESSAIPEIYKAMIGKIRKDRRQIFSKPAHDRLFKSQYHHVDLSPANDEEDFDEEFDEKEADDESDPCKNCDERFLIRRRPRPDHHCEVHYGLIASGNSVIKDPITRNQIGKDLGALCCEMEAAGLMNNPGFSCLVVRGISDYCDSHKNDQWQPYAAMIAAAYTKELLSYVNSDSTRTISSLKSATASIVESTSLSGPRPSIYGIPQGFNGSLHRTPSSTSGVSEFETSAPFSSPQKQLFNSCSSPLSSSATSYSTGQTLLPPTIDLHPGDNETRFSSVIPPVSANSANQCIEVWLGAGTSGSYGSIYLTVPEHADSSLSVYLIGTRLPVKDDCHPLIFNLLKSNCRLRRLGVDDVYNPDTNLNLCYGQRCHPIDWVLEGKRTAQLVSEESLNSRDYLNNSSLTWNVWGGGEYPSERTVVHIGNEVVFRDWFRPKSSEDKHALGMAKISKNSPCLYTGLWYAYESNQFYYFVPYFDQFQKDPEMEIMLYPLRSTPEFFYGRVLYIEEGKLYRKGDRLPVAEKIQLELQVENPSFHVHLEDPSSNASVRNGRRSRIKSCTFEFEDDDGMTIRFDGELFRRVNPVLSYTMRDVENWYSHGTSSTSGS